MRRFAVSLTMLLLASVPASFVSAYEPIQTASLLNLSIEELTQVKVTSVAKKEQSLFDAPAAIYVITQDDIRRSGATNIPDALRLAPGLEVSRSSASMSSVSSRGGNINLLLVLIDGRTVYDPLIAGVQWFWQNIMLEDIDRIEVIRGPGGSLWGSNAVNGVINIITKAAKDTQGGLVYAGGGSLEKGFGGIRYGAKLGSETSYRIYAKDFYRSGSVYPSGEHAPDKLQEVRAGFRIDSDLSSRDQLTMHGDIFTGSSDSEFKTKRVPVFKFDVSDNTDLSGGYIMAAWKRTFSQVSNMRLQLYYDQKERDDATFGEKVDTLDIDFQHRLPWGGRQDVIWGGGYRTTWDWTKGSFLLSLDPPNATNRIFNVFVQDDITLKEDKLHLIAGTKLEHNDFTGFEVSPNVRLLWTPDKDNTLWAAVSRAVHAANRFENNVLINVEASPGPPPVVFSAKSNPDAKSESVVSYELGYRNRPAEKVYFDIAAFSSSYKNLIATAAGAPLPPTTSTPYVIIPITFDNGMHGDTYGAEVDAHWSVKDWWRLEVTYSYLRMFLHYAAQPANEGQEGNSPRNQASLRSSLDIFSTIESDLWLRYVENLPTPKIRSYATLDARLAWKPVKDLELAVVGQNLLGPRHLESPVAPQLFVERSVYGKVAWSF